MLMQFGRPPLPKEHGAWAMLLTPPIVALLTLGADSQGILAVLGWFLAYALRGPVEVLLGRGASGRAGMARAERPVARFWFVLFGVLAIALLLPAAWAQPGVLWLLAVASGLLGIVWWLSLRGEARSLLSGVLAVSGLMAGAPLYYLAATGSVPSSGWTLTAGCLAFFGGSILRVKAVARERRSSRFRWLTAAVHLAFVVGAGTAALLDWAPALLALALTPPLLFTIYQAWLNGQDRPPANLGAVGKTEIGLTVSFALLLIISLRV